MTRTILTLAVVCLSAANATGQSSYPPVPSPTCPPRPVTRSVPGWVPYGYHASTAAEGQMRGAAAIIAAEGQWNLKTSQARVYAQQAQRLAIENRLRNVEVYNKTRQMNKELRTAERGSHAKIAQAGSPKAGTQVQRPASLFDETGKIAWPIALQAEKYERQREMLDRFVAARSAGLSSADRAGLHACLRDCAEQLQGDVREVPGGQYIAAKHFLAALAAMVGSGGDRTAAAGATTLAGAGW